MQTGAVVVGVDVVAGVTLSCRRPVKSRLRGAEGGLPRLGAAATPSSRTSRATSSTPRTTTSTGGTRRCLPGSWRRRATTTPTSRPRTRAWLLARRSAACPPTTTGSGKGKAATTPLVGPRWQKPGIKVGAKRDGGSYEPRSARFYAWNSQGKNRDYLLQKWQEFITGLIPAQ